MAPKTWIVVAAVIAVTIAGAGRPPTGSSPTDVATIALNPSIAYQTFDGWEATAQATQVDGPTFAIHPTWATDSPVLMDLLVNDLGITRTRLELRSGVENPTDYYRQFQDRQIDRPSGFNPHRYDVVNDNNDPFVTDQSKFHWTELDEDIQLLVMPFRAKVLASGQTPYVDLCYIDFDNVSAFKHSDNPDEYAEFVLAAFQHIQTRWGWVPDGFEVILEGDIAERWQDPVKIGRSLAAASARLAAAGFHPEFIAPSSTSLTWAVNNFDAMVGVPGVAQALKTVSYHLYWNNADADLVALSAKASARGMKTAMTELIGADHVTLSSDLRRANVSAWQQFGMASYYLPDAGGKYYINTGSGYYAGDRTRYLRQYFRYIRPGARRIDAASSSGSLTPVAFINANGGYTVVVNATSAQSFTVQNLPAASYGIRYTTASATDGNPGDQTLTSTGSISTSIPGAGAITIFRIGTAPGSGGSSSGRRRPPGVAATGTAIPRSTSGSQAAPEKVASSSQRAAAPTRKLSLAEQLGPLLSWLILAEDLGRPAPLVRKGSGWHRVEVEDPDSHERIDVIWLQQPDGKIQFLTVRRVIK